MLGEYETKKRCLEILDEIQECLMPTYKKYKQAEITLEQWDKIFDETPQVIKLPDNTGFIETDTIVYQMPESEVAYERKTDLC